MKLRAAGLFGESLSLRLRGNGRGEELSRGTRPILPLTVSQSGNPADVIISQSDKIFAQSGILGRRDNLLCLILGTGKAFICRPHNILSPAHNMDYISTLRVREKV